jgi:hypothetical protein
MQGNETSARSESKRMTNHNTPQLSRMDLANHCAAFPGLSRLNTRAVDFKDKCISYSYKCITYTYESNRLVSLTNEYQKQA